MDKNKYIQSRILANSPLDPKDEFDEKLERCFKLLQSMLGMSHDRDVSDQLQSFALQGPQNCEDVMSGLLYMILTDPKICKKCYEDMVYVATDGMTSILSKINQIIHEKWIKLLDTPRQQILWLTRQLVNSSINGTETVCNSLLRQIAGGDISPKNIWLTESLLTVFLENRDWVDKHSSLLQAAVYTYLRVIADHGNPSFSALRQNEVDFCIVALREKWTDCMNIGRDLVRLLQYVGRIPEFEKLWKDILHSPTTLSPTFTGVQQLMLSRTSRRLIACRLTPDMENKLIFLTNKVRFGQQKRYQDWFQRQYLSTPESQSLRCDLIRYICAVIHPSNEVLGSDIIPRWAVIGWLLTTCTSNVDASYAKLALFYDWLFFDPEKESIMNIEPCILVMYHSMRPHPVITATLLDFMCRIMHNFYPPLAQQVKKGIHTALKFILDKRVLQSISPLFDNPKLDRELRIMIRDKFAEFCSQDAKDDPLLVPKDQPPDPSDVSASNNADVHNHSPEIAEFSDEDEELHTSPIAIVVPSDSSTFMPIKELPKRSKTPIAIIDITEYIRQLDGPIKACVQEFEKTKDNVSAQCEVMDNLVQTMIQERLDGETVSTVALCLSQLMASQFSHSPLPQDLDDESIEDSIGAPLYVLFRNLCQTPEEDPARQPILMLMEEIYQTQPKIAYHLLYFLKVSKVHDEGMIAYKDFCNGLQNKDLGSSLLADLTLCQEDDVRLFTFLVPDIYTQFSNVTLGNSDLLHLIVSSIDGSQLQELICEVLQGHLVMFRKESFLSILNASLEWETIEQYFLWQFITAHDIPAEQIIPILPKLEYIAHAEALTNVMILLKQEYPSSELLRAVLCRECRKHDLFAVSVIKHWAKEYEDKLADLLCSQLTKNTSTPNRKRQRQGQQSVKCKDKDGPTVEQTLSHLEHMRQTCKNIAFITHESLQQGLQHVQANCSEQLKSKFGDLLALAEDFDDPRNNTRVLRRVASRRASEAASMMASGSQKSVNNVGNKKKMSDDLSTDSESSDDDDLAKPKRKRKKTYSIPVDDDSD